MTTKHETLAAFKFPQSPSMPLLPLSSERINAASQTPPQQLTSTNHASPTPSGFGHPELGEPGDFSKFPTSPHQPRIQLENGSSEESTESENEARPFVSSIQHARSIFGRDSNAGNAQSNRNELSKWSPSKFHSRISSDVQGMVARFNSLDIKDYGELRKKEAAALKRAEMGREEAEEEIRRLKEEARAMKKEIDEGRDRERRVVKRLDVLMEDLHRSKETQAHAQNLYEKEIKKARKEAFKASSTMVKLQEELKSARRALGVVQSDLDLERIKLSRKEQDAFAAQYQLVGAQEELTQAQAHVKIVEEERDALKTSLQEEEVSRIAAEGKLALPPSKPDDEEFGSPKKKHTLDTTPTKELIHSKSTVDQLQVELEYEVGRRKAAEDQVEFMKMECQFGCCSCRMAEQNHSLYTHDTSLQEQIQQFKNSISVVFASPSSVGLLPEPPKVGKATDPGNQSPKEDKVLNDTDDDDVVVFIEQSPFTPERNPDFANDNPALTSELTYEEESVSKTDETSHTSVSYAARIGPSARSEEQSAHTSINREILRMTPPHLNSNHPVSTPAAAAIPLPTSCTKEHEELKDEEYDENTPSYNYNHNQETYNSADYSSSWRTVTTTTKVPLVDESSTPDYGAFFSPMTLTREEAIEQLRIRRGRTRSAAGTPRKPLAEQASVRRDISAPEVKIKGTPRSVSRDKDRRRG